MRAFGVSYICNNMKKPKLTIQWGTELDFDEKWSPTAVQPLYPHDGGHRFSPSKCSPGFQSCQTSSILTFEEPDSYETVS
jgi:hypothetical protein